MTLVLEVDLQNDSVDLVPIQVLVGLLYQLPSFVGNDFLLVLFEMEVPTLSFLWLRFSYGHIDLSLLLLHGRFDELLQIVGDCVDFLENS